MFRAWLKRRFSPEWRKSALVGVGMAGLNIGLLTLFVGLLGDPTAANACRTPISTQVRFGFDRWFTWRSRHEPFWQQWRQHHYLKLVTVPISLCGFWTLASVVGLPHLTAYSLCCIGTGAISYFCKKYRLWRLAKSYWRRTLRRRTVFDHS